jgi:hypothetical protein
MTTRCMYLLPLAMGCQPDQDLFGGGTFEVSFGDGGPVSGSFVVPGATQECLDGHRQTPCTDPKATMANYSEDSTTLEDYYVSAWLHYPAAEDRPDCMGDAELELLVFVAQGDGDSAGGRVWFTLEDPVLAEDDPNADQGGATSPAIEGVTDLDTALEPTAAGSVSATLPVTELRNCELEEGLEVEMSVVWEFDPSVTAGAGLFTLD